MTTALNHILFIDIETVSVVERYGLLSERLKPHWDKKSGFLKGTEDKNPEDTFSEKSAIYAEFGKVLCIGIGAYIEGDTKFRVKTLYQESEKDLLLEFKQILEKHPSGANLVLCAHNGKEFDFPYLCRRMLINEISLPEILDISGKKPWEIKHLDTLELWKFGDYKNFTSLDLLASVFDIPGSKSLMDGSQVNSEFYQKNNLTKILEYCTEDVVVLSQLYLKLNGKSILSEENILRV